MSERTAPGEGTQLPQELPAAHAQILESGEQTSELSSAGF